VSARVRVYDSHDLARKMRETFVDRAVERKLPYGWHWPARLQDIGDSVAVAYASDKWEPKTASGKRKIELYKHIAESRNRCLAQPDLLYDYYERDQRWPVRGPMVSFTEAIAMPDTFAMLGLFEELCLRLYTKGTNESPRFGQGDDGIVHTQLRHAFLAGGMMRLAEQRYRPFIFAFQKSSGVQFIVVGDELDIEKDGIVG
jgi:hypothetical protein